MHLSWGRSSLHSLVATCPARMQNRRQPDFPGPIEGGFLLPNGWRVTPAGQQVLLTDLPLNILTSADGKYAFVATSGYNAHELTAVELATRAKGSDRDGAAKLVRPGAADATATRASLWWSGGGDARASLVRLERRKLEPAEPYPPPAIDSAPRRTPRPPPVSHRALLRRKERRALFADDPAPMAATNRSPGAMPRPRQWRAGGRISRDRQSARRR